MTISSTSITAGPYSTNGATTTFSFAFKVETYGEVAAEDQLEVVLITTSTGAQTVLARGVAAGQYGVTLNPDQDASPGGEITTVTTYAAGYTIYIRLAPVFKQATDLENQAAYYAEVVEDQFDNTTRQVLELYDRMRRAPYLGVQAGPSFTGKMTGPISPGYVPMINSDESGWELGVPSSGAAISEAMAPVVTSSTVLAGLAELGFYETRTAAAADTIPSTLTFIRVASYAAIGDGGGAKYRRSASAPSHGAYFQSADGAYWILDEAIVNIRMLGAKGDLTQNDTPAIQAAIDYAAGGVVFAPVGQYRMDSGVSSTLPMHVRGVGNGAGPGGAAQANSNVTQFIAYFSSGDVFACTSNYPCIFENFQINTAVANRPRSSGAGIHVSGPSSPASTNANTKIRTVGMTNQYDCVRFTRTSMPEVSSCYFDGWVRAGVYAETTAGIEGGLGNIKANYFFGTSGSTSQQACVLTLVGYGYINNNLLLGASYGVQLAVTAHAAGSLHIFDNFIENQGTTGVLLGSVDGNTAAMVKIHRNAFSNVDFLTSYTASIVASDYSSGTDWLDDLDISHNVHRHNMSVNHRYVWVLSGRTVLISNEQFENLGAGASTIGVDLSTFASAALKAPAIVSDCQFRGTFATKYALTSVTELHESQGLTYAQVSALAPANGSRVYVTDGNLSAAAFAGSSTGCFAERINDAWIAAGFGQVLPVARGGTGSSVGQQFKKQVFTAGGTFTTSAGINTSTVFKVTVTGAGGGGEGGATGNVTGSGGGAGGTAIKWYTGLSASTGYTVTVGTAGTAGTAGGGNGGNGGASSFAGPGTTITGNGGTGGGGNGDVLGPAGGSGSNGDINISGGNGASGMDGASTWRKGGEGGTSMWGGGGRGGVSSNGASADGTAGVPYGSGGGGGGAGAANQSAGAAGAGGVVIVEWIE